MDIRQNHFELFGLPETYALNDAALDKAYRERQQQVHPDRFASAGDAEKRVALQWATRVNEAYRTLRSPLARASYLCELRGAALESESNTAMPGAFLLRQMEWRERLADARVAADLGELDAIGTELRSTRGELQSGIASALDVQQDNAQAAQLVRQLMFIEKLDAELDAALEQAEA